MFLLSIFFQFQEKLEKRGWSVPAYSCSKGADELKIMRVVVKNNFSMVLCDLLLKDIEEVFDYFDRNVTDLPTIEELQVFDEEEFAGLKTDAELRDESMREMIATAGSVGLTAESLKVYGFFIGSGYVGSTRCKFN